MVTATILSLIVVPMLYFVIQTIMEKLTGGKKAEDAAKAVESSES